MHKAARNRLKADIVYHIICGMWFWSPWRGGLSPPPPRQDPLQHDWLACKRGCARGGVQGPIPVQAVDSAGLLAAVNGGELALAGYAIDRPYVLSVHRGCTAAINPFEPGLITHMCDSTPGESGGPLLLLRDGGAVVIGLHSANAQRLVVGMVASMLGRSGKYPPDRANNHFMNSNSS